MTYFDNDFCIIDYNDDLVTVTWKPTSATMSDADFKEQQTKQSDCIVENKASKLLINGLNFGYTITPDLQEWTIKTHIPKAIENGLQKTATIVPDELFAQVSVEQTMDEAKDMPMQSKYFKDEKSALKWLNS